MQHHLEGMPEEILDSALARLAGKIVSQMQSSCAGIFIDLLIEKRSRMWAKKVAEQRARRGNVFRELLWNIDAIAAYLVLSPRAISERVVRTPGFPKPVVKCSDPAREGDARVRPERWWLATEIIAWALSYKVDVAPDNRVAVEWGHRESLLLDSIGTQIKRDHHHVRKTRDALKRRDGGSLDECRHIEPPTEALQVIVSPALRNRALRLMNVLLALLDSRRIGYWLIGGETLVGVPDFTFSITLSETAKHACDIDRTASGRLRLDLVHGQRRVFTIEDGTLGPIEGLLPRLVVYIAIAVHDASVGGHVARTFWS